MKKLSIPSVILSLVLATSVVTANAKELKIGVVNAAVVMDQSPQKQKALAKLEKEFSGRRKKLKNRLAALKAMQEKLAKDGAILTADERQKKERKILKEQRELKRLQDEYSEDLSIRRNQELRKLEQEIAKTIIDLAKKESYDLVLYQGVIYASDQVNMTQKVLDILKAKAK